MYTELTANNYEEAGTERVCRYDSELHKTSCERTHGVATFFISIVCNVR